jgi:hypothetical protein
MVFLTQEPYRKKACKTLASYYCTEVLPIQQWRFVFDELDDTDRIMLSLNYKSSSILLLSRSDRVAWMVGRRGGGSLGATKEDMTPFRG